MAGWLAGCRIAVMAAGTVTGYVGVVKVRRHPAVGGMTALAVVTTLDMLAMLACSRRTIVTTRASALHMCMVDPDYRCPGRVAVATLA